MTPLRRKQLKDNIFLKSKTRQALTVFVLRCIFCFGHELGRAFLLQHSPLPQAAVGQCFDDRNEIANFTFAPIDFHPHGYVIVPGYW